MKYFNKLRVLKTIFFLGVASLFVSCTTANYEVVVAVDMSTEISKRARNKNDADFKEVFNVALETHQKTKGDFIEIFLKKSDKLKPGRAYIKYFKSNSKLKINASNEEVKSFFRDKREESYDRVLEVLSYRFDDLGVASIEIIEGLDQVKIGISKAAEEKFVARLITATAKIEFHEVHSIYDLRERWNEMIELSKPKLKVEVNIDSLGYENELDESLNLTSGSDYDGVMSFIKISEGAFYVANEHKDAVESFLNTAEVKEVLPHNLVFRWSEDQINNDEGEMLGYALYPLKIGRKGRSLVSQSNIESASFEFDETNGSNSVMLLMNKTGSKEFKELTISNIGNQIAICLNDKVVSAPFVREAIQGGRIQISGNFTESEAKELAAILEIGSLPVFCQFVSMKKL